MEEQDEFIWKEKLYFSGKTGDTQTGKTDEVQRTVNSGWNVVIPVKILYTKKK